MSIISREAWTAAVANFYEVPEWRAAVARFGPAPSWGVDPDATEARDLLSRLDTYAPPPARRDDFGFAFPRDSGAHRLPYQYTRDPTDPIALRSTVRAGILAREAADEPRIGEMQGAEVRDGEIKITRASAEVMASEMLARDDKRKRDAGRGPCTAEEIDAMADNMLAVVRSLRTFADARRTTAKMREEAGTDGGRSILDQILDEAAAGRGE